MKTLIIDDQIRSRRVLKRMILQYCNNLNLTGEADNIDDAIELIKTSQPDLIFLDVDLGDGTGFDLLGQLKETNSFKTIFVTAHESYAIKAIKWSAQDYLLKPVDPTELVASVNKAAQVVNRAVPDKDLQSITNDSNNVGLPTMEGLKFVRIKDIVRCEAKGSYTSFYFKDGEKLIASKPLQVYEEIFIEHNFFRIHKSHLVNLNEIKEYIKGRGGNVVMADGMVIAVAMRKKEEFLKRILH